MAAVVACDKPTDAVSNSGHSKNFILRSLGRFGQQIQMISLARVMQRVLKNPILTAMVVCDDSSMTTTHKLLIPLAAYPGYRPKLS